jgi:excinuclease ABC subunit B
VQDRYNVENGIVPQTIKKDIRDVINIGLSEAKESDKKARNKKLTKGEKEKKIAQLTTEMRAAAQKLEFEKAAYLRDLIKKLKDE